MGEFWWALAAQLIIKVLQLLIKAGTGSFWSTGMLWAWPCSFRCDLFTASPARECPSHKILPCPGGPVVPSLGEEGRQAGALPRCQCFPRWVPLSFLPINAALPARLRVPPPCLFIRTGLPGATYVSVPCWELSTLQVPWFVSPLPTSRLIFIFFFLSHFDSTKFVCFLN